MTVSSLPFTGGEGGRCLVVGALQREEGEAAQLGCASLLLVEQFAADQLSVQAERPDFCRLWEMQLRMYNASGMTFY